MKSKQLKYSVIILFIVFFPLILSSHVYALEKGEVQKSNIKPINNGSYFSFKPSVNLRPQKRAQSQQTEVLPEKYDLRNLNGKSYVTPPENQNPWGCCWAFGALSAAESNTILKGGPSNVNFSKRALTYFSFQNQNGESEPVSSREGLSITSNYTQNSKLAFNAGGDIGTVVSQMATWNGASSSAQIPYQNDEGIITSVNEGNIEYSAEGTWSVPYNDIYDNNYHLSNAHNISTYGDYSENWIDEYTIQAKKLIMENGAIMLGFGFYEEGEYYSPETNAQYVSNTKIPNHAVSIVGWDDTYPITNFNSKNQPPAPGAWICKNNWSTLWGNDGYFYLSYYDHTITDFCSFSVETQSEGFSFDNNNQYDYLANKNELSRSASVLVSNALIKENINPNQVKFANIFTAENDQILKAVSSYTFSDNAVITIQIYLLDENDLTPEDGNLVLTQVENTDKITFQTINLNQPIELPADQKYAVVENIVYKDQMLDEVTIADVPGVALEYGTNVSVPIQLPSINWEEMIPAYFNFHIDQTPGRTMVYGLNSGDPSWYDVTSPEIQELLSVPIQSYFDSSSPIMAIPGSALIKAYTDNVVTPDVPATNISVNNGIETIYLSTLPGAQNSITLNAVVTPANSTEPVTWTISTDNVAALTQVSGTSTILNAIASGRAELTVTAGATVTTIPIIVENDPIICTNVTVSQPTPDYYSILIEDVIPNPALNQTGTIKKVSIFNWSALDENNIQIDMNAKVAQQIPGTNNWQWEGFPINDNDYHTFFINAQDITVNIYATMDLNTEGNLIAAGTVSWVNEISAGDNLLAYIGYSQNIGFNKPTVFNGFLTGSIVNPRHLEGLRISDNIQNLNISTNVHIQNLGWLGPFDSGVYAGTMHRNLGIEAVQLNLTGDNAPYFELEYRVYQMNKGWQNWVSTNQVAGSTGENNQIQAIEVRLLEKNH